MNNYPGWLAELINEYNCGIAVPPDDAQAYAGALIKLADNREYLPVMGSAGKKLAMDMFNRNKLSSQFVGWMTNEENVGAKACS